MLMDEFPLLEPISIHTPAKGVTFCFLFFQHFRAISIHTPAKGVTRTRVLTLNIDYYFNPHSREGSDCPKANFTFLDLISIHTPAKGVTLSLENQAKTKLISIHTPAKGVTNRQKFCDCSDKISIHTPAKGVTSYSSKKDYPDYNFNPHSREGSDKIWIQLHLRERLFQSTLPRRE